MPLTMPERRWNLHHLHQRMSVRGSVMGVGVGDDGSFLRSRPTPTATRLLGSVLRSFLRHDSDVDTAMSSAVMI